MAWRHRGCKDDIELCPLLANNDKVRWPIGPHDKLRFMVLGGDDALLDKACATILGERDRRDAFQFGELRPREAQVCGRQVSVLKTPSYWLEHLKSYYIFSNGVKKMFPELQFFESLLFPGPNAFLLVIRDEKSSGKENYLLCAFSEVFGKEVLDYCMVLFIDTAKLIDPKQNTCVKMCGGRYHILQNTDESVHQLFKKTKVMAQWKSSTFFTTHLECFRKAEKYFVAENEIRQRKLRRKLGEHKESVKNLKKEMNNLKEIIAEEVKKLNEKIEDELKKLATERENNLSNQLDALRRENQMKEDFEKQKEELHIHKNIEKKLHNEIDALENCKEQMEEELQKIKEELHSHKNREKKLHNEIDALESCKEQMKEELQKIKDESTFYRDRENHLRTESDALKISEDQLKEDIQKLKEDLSIYENRENLLSNEIDALKKKEKQMNKDFQKLKNELTFYRDKESATH